jgi:hypothetical protein
VLKGYCVFAVSVNGDGRGDEVRVGRSVVMTSVGCGRTSGLYYITVQSQLERNHKNPEENTE